MDEVVATSTQKRDSHEGKEWDMTDSEKFEEKSQERNILT